MCVRWVIQQWEREADWTTIPRLGGDNSQVASQQSIHHRLGEKRDLPRTAATASSIELLANEVPGALRSYPMVQVPHGEPATSFQASGAPQASIAGVLGGQLNDPIIASLSKGTELYFNVNTLR